MYEMVTISITSYRMSMGGEHYYGRLDVETKMTPVTEPDGKVRYVTRVGYGVETHPHDRHELTRVLSAREAAYLNKKDDGGFFTSSMGLKRGDRTKRFNDKASIIAAAIEIFPTLFDETDVLEYREDPYGEAGEILVAPDEVREALSTRKGRQAREEWLIEHGYLVKNLEPFHPKNGY